MSIEPRGISPLLIFDKKLMASYKYLTPPPPPLAHMSILVKTPNIISQTVTGAQTTDDPRASVKGDSNNESEM